jgi:hypothetical protein
MHATEIVKSHPAAPERDLKALVACIEACFDCEQTCTACADACLHEKKVADLAFCIRTDLDCADVCAALGRSLSRASRPDADAMRTLLVACAAACRACGDECRKHASMHDHCRICAEACQKCDKACQALISATPA